MTPVFQDRFGRGYGNCLQAAVASVLDLPLGDVPNFSDAEGDWFLQLAQWAVLHGWGVLHLSPKDDVKYLAVGAYGVGVWSVDGNDECHALVMHFGAALVDGVWVWNAKAIHNPNPCLIQPALLEWKELLFFIPRGMNSPDHA